LFDSFELSFEKDAVSFGFLAEMENQPDFVFRRCEVSEKLTGCTRVQDFGRLDLRDDLVVDDHIEHLKAERLAAKEDRDGEFSDDTMSFSDEVTLEGCGVK